MLIIIIFNRECFFFKRFLHTFMWKDMDNIEHDRRIKKIVIKRINYFVFTELGLP